MATNNAGNIGTASSGQALQSAGAGSALTFSTPTYPSSSGSAGKILRSDGTNNIYSTATYPDTAGTSGNVLTSDGTNWTSSAFSGGNLLIASKNITSSQVKALHATPIEIIAAPGAGKGIVVVGAAAKLNYGGTNVFTAGASQTIGIFYNNGTTAIISGANFIPNAMITSSANSFSIAGINSTPIITTNNNQAAGVLDNVNVSAFNNIATEITGNAGGDNTFDIIVGYYIITY